MNEITFTEQDCKVGFMRRNDTRECLLKVLKRLNCISAGVTYIFCSDEYLLEINRNYLNHDTFTDVITFDYMLSDNFFPGEKLSASILLDSKNEGQADMNYIDACRQSFAFADLFSPRPSEQVPSALGLSKTLEENMLLQAEGGGKNSQRGKSCNASSDRSASKKSKTEKLRPVAGDIYISIDRIKENAKMFHVKHIDELNRVMIHGLLHLAGYKDKTPVEEKKIHEKEDEMLATCFYGYEHLLKAKRK